MNFIHNYFKNYFIKIFKEILRAEVKIQVQAELIRIANTDIDLKNKINEYLYIKKESEAKNSFEYILKFTRYPFHKLQFQCVLCFDNGLEQDYKIEFTSWQELYSFAQKMQKENIGVNPRLLFTEETKNFIPQLVGIKSCTVYFWFVFGGENKLEAWRFGNISEIYRFFSLDSVFKEIEEKLELNPDLLL